MGKVFGSVGLSELPLPVAQLLERLHRPDCGGIGVFVGTVRETPAGKDGSHAQVVHLDYEAHEELAPATLETIASEAAARWDLKLVTAVHRVGRCDVGDPTVFVGCAAEHRAEALTACRWIIDAIKTRVPIWKREIYRDGSSWVGTGS